MQVKWIQTQIGEQQLIRDYFSRQVYDYNYGNQSMPINLYVITSNKVEATGFSQNYGNWIQKDVIKNLGVDFNASSNQPSEKSWLFGLG